MHNAYKPIGNSNGTPSHKAAIDSKVKFMENSIKCDKIYVNKALKTAGLNGSQRPDIIGIRNTGKIDIFEYASPSQLSGTGRTNLITKFSTMLRNNPGSGGRIYW